MELVICRTHRTGLFGVPVVYSVTLLASFSQSELKAIAYFRLGNTLLYERLEMADGGTGLLGMLYRRSFHAMNLTVSVNDVIFGKRLEFGSLPEALVLEDQIVNSLFHFQELLKTAIPYDGLDEVPL